LNVVKVKVTTDAKLLLMFIQNSSLDLRKRRYLKVEGLGEHRMVDEDRERFGLRHVHRGRGRFVVNIRAVEGRVVADQDLMREEET